MDTGESATDASLVWAWNLQNTWSLSATKLKESLFQARKASLWLTVSAAVLATLSAQVADCYPVGGRVLAVLSALAIGLTTFSQRACTRKQVEDWTRARTVSEALKGEVFRYLAHVEPYRSDDRADVFTAHVDRIRAYAEDLGSVIVGVSPPARSLPAVTDVDSYIAKRVRQQIDTYYRPQSTKMRRLGDRYRTASTVLAVVAMVLGIAATFTGWNEFAVWAPVATTMIAAVAAYSAVNRYDALALEYSRTSEQLERLLLDRPRASGTNPEQADDRFVTEAEAVISVQNEAWMVRSVAAIGEGDGGTDLPPAPGPA